MRKYKILTIILLVVSIIFTGCKRARTIEEDEISGDLNIDINSKEKVESKIDTIEDYFPFKENTILNYEGIGNEFAEQVVFLNTFGNELR